MESQIRLVQIWNDPTFPMQRTSGNLDAIWTH